MTLLTPSERSFARRIDLTSLQLFVAVCELGSIGRAAEREFIAASAISKRLSDLETTLNTSLLYRHARGVDLTPAGESLLHHARSVLYSLEKMQGELSEYADGVRGHVRVHANISAIVQFLPEDLGAFRRLHDAIKIDLEEHLSTEVLRAVQEGAADLGVCHIGAPGGNGSNGTSGNIGDTASPKRNGSTAGELQTLHYRDDRLVLVVPAGHVLALQDPIDFAATLDHNIEEFGAAAFFPFLSKRQGIVHVIGPESGATLPGMTPMPRPFSIIRHMASRPVTWMRSRNVRPASSAAWRVAT